MRELTEVTNDVKIFHHQNRLIYVAHKWTALICLFCGGALTLHTFVPQAEVRFPLFQACSCAHEKIKKHL